MLAEEFVMAVVVDARIAVAVFAVGKKIAMRTSSRTLTVEIVLVVRIEP